jgi:cytochrome P450
MMLLSKAPEALYKMREEVAQIFGTNFNEIAETAISAPEKLQQLSYVEAVINETLRLFPIAFLVRAAKEYNDVLSYKGHTYPIGRGMMIAVNPIDFQYNPKYFPDPTTFRPERWLDSNNKIPRYYFATFSLGPRSCLGRNMAMNELKVVLISIIHDFDFECANLEPNATPHSLYTDLDTKFGNVIFQTMGLSASPRGGMIMRVKKR